MNFKKVALALSGILIGIGLTMSGAMGGVVSALTGNDAASTMEESIKNGMESMTLGKSFMEGGSGKQDSLRKANHIHGKLGKRKAGYSRAELRMMASIIYCEANGEPYAGKKAVGIVVMNRMKTRGFPNTIKGVIYQRGQFGPAWNGSLRRALANWDAGRFKSPAAKQCVRAAKETLRGDTRVKIGGKYKNMTGYRFFSGSMSNPRYRIGRHVFK